MSMHCQNNLVKFEQKRCTVKKNKKSFNLILVHIHLKIKQKMEFHFCINGLMLLFILVLLL